MSEKSNSSGYRFAFSIVTVVFFMWGFITCMNDILIPKFKSDFDLSQFQANLIQSAFFGAFFLISLCYFFISAAKGDPINKIGYKNGLILGLIVTAVGCILFWPASQTKVYPLFLGALFIVGSGVTLLQISANPYVAVLGSEAFASMRLNLSQGLNSLGYVIAPLIGGYLIFGTDIYAETGGSDAVKIPYIGLTVVLIALAIFLKFISLPSIHQTESPSAGVRAFRYPHFKWGMLAIFCYVGAEVTVGSILVNYLAEDTVLNFTEAEATKYLAFYWGGLMIGRLVGAISLSNLAAQKKVVLMLAAATVSTLIIFANATFKQKLTTDTYLDPMAILPFLGLIGLSFLFFFLGKAKPNLMVGLFSIVACVLTLLSMFTNGHFALWAIIGIGLFNSIMWSNIFTLSIKGLGEDTAQGSSLLVMMIVGGALLPPLQGILADYTSQRASLIIVFVAYAYLIFFGFIGSKQKELSAEEVLQKDAA